MESTYGLLRLNPANNKWLRHVKDNRFSFLFKRSKGIEGRVARSLTKDLMPLVTARGKRRLKYSLELVLYNCYLCWTYSKMYPGYEFEAKYTRNRARYGKDEKYGLKNLSHWIFTKTLERLEDHRYIELDTQKRFSKQLSSFSPTNKMYDLFEQYHSELKVVRHKVNTPLIVLKDEDKNPIEFIDDAETIRIKEAVEFINTSQKTHDFSLVIPGNDMTQFFSPPTMTSDGRMPIGALWFENVVMLFDNWHECMVRFIRDQSMGKMFNFFDEPSDVFHRTFGLDHEVCKTPLPTYEQEKDLTCKQHNIQQEAQSLDISQRHLTKLSRYYDITRANPSNLFMYSKSFKERKEEISKSPNSIFFSNTKHQSSTDKELKCRVVTDVSAFYDYFNDKVVVSLNNLTEYHRTFNNRSFQSGGRFYAEIQNLPSEARRYLHIDGKPTYEGDFNAMHLRMALWTKLREEIEAPDAYSIPVPGWDNAKAIRKAIKKASLRLLNSTSRKQGIGAVQQSINKKKLTVPNGINSVALEQALLRAYPRLEKLMFSGLGGDLQYLDSQVAEKILTTFSKMGKGIGCWHDGFRVKREDLDLLVLTMSDAHKEVVGCKGVVSVDE